MGPWLVAVAWADPPPVAPGPALYVVDAYVVRTVTFDLMGIHWTADRRPPGTTRQVRYCVAWDRPPIGSGDNTSVVSEEWVVIDAGGNPLTVEQFASATGLPARKSRAHKALLGGAQLAWSRREVETAVAERSGPSGPWDARRRQIVNTLPSGCSESPPGPIGGP